jgi:hypothetical protein
MGTARVFAQFVHIDGVVGFSGLSPPAAVQGALLVLKAQPFFGLSTLAEYRACRPRQSVAGSLPSTGFV